MDTHVAATAKSALERATGLNKAGGLALKELEQAQNDYRQATSELKRAAAEVSCRPLADQYIEAVGDCPIPPGANVCSGLVRDLAWVLLAWVPPRPRAA